MAVGEFFTFRSDWHQDDRADPLVRQYQLTLDAILRDRPDLVSCAVHCCQCGIRFLTHPRNAHRRDLRCEFGCRQHHRRQQANARSTRHYQTAHGRKAKKRLNGRRSLAGSGSAAGPTRVATEADTSAPAPAHSEPAACDEVTLLLSGFALDEVTLANSALLPYLAMVASLLEWRPIGVTELLWILRRSMRQRSFDRLPRREYVLRFLNQRPP